MGFDFSAGKSCKEWDLERMMAGECCTFPNTTVQATVFDGTSVMKWDDTLSFKALQQTTEVDENLVYICNNVQDQSAPSGLTMSTLNLLQ